MEKDIFNIIEEKDYTQLSAQELEMVAEFCANEDEYRQMQHVLIGTKALTLEEMEAPRQATKDQLDDLFAAQSFPKAAPIWYNKLGVLLYPRDKKFHQRPLVQLAAVFVLLLGIIPFLMTSNQPYKKEQLAQHEQQRSTNEVLVEQKTPGVREDASGEVVLNQTKEMEMLTENKQLSKSDNNRAFASDEVSKPNPPVADFEDLSMEITAGVISRSASSTHPDGIFMDKNAASPTYSIALSDQVDVLDLLTATF